MKKIILFGAIGLVIGISAGTGVSALKGKKVLTAELVARQDSIAAVKADSLVALEHGESDATSSHGEAVLSSSEAQTDASFGTEPEAFPGTGVEEASAAGHVENVDSAQAEAEEGDPTASQSEDLAGELPDDSLATGEAEGGPPPEAQGTEAEPASTGGEVSTPTQVSALPSIPYGALPGTGPVGDQGTTANSGGEGPIRLAKIFGAMDADEAAAVLENLEDVEVQSILRHISDRKAAAILSNFDPARAAMLSRVVMGVATGGGG